MKFTPVFAHSRSFLALSFLFLRSSRILAAALLLCTPLLFSMIAQADDRLIGSWAPSNIPVTVPEGAALKIVRTGSGYSGAPETTFVVPAPTACSVGPDTTLVTFTPLSKQKFNVNFNTLTPGSCLPVALDSVEVEVTFADDGRSFIACQRSARCSSWIRIGAAPDPVSTKTLPTTPAVSLTKSTIAVAWDTLPGVIGYVITLKGPVTITKTVKRGNGVKFTKLGKGTYKVSMAGSFKDAKGKVKRTRSTPAVQIKITK